MEYEANMNAQAEAEAQAGQAEENALVECAKHRIDYRIACEECQEKYTRFNDLITQSLNKNIEATKGGK